MIQKLLVLFYICISLSILPAVTLHGKISVIPQVFAEEAAVDAETKTMKINSINFDNSDSIIFLGTSLSEEAEIPKITKKTLTDPDRVYFDIENAVITFSDSTYELKNSRLKQVRIAQNSISPNIVRVVIHVSDGYDSSEIKVLNIKNNIIIKLGSEKPLQQYLTQVYKETKESSIEYYDKAVVIAEGKKTQEADEIFNSIQRAFSEDGQELVRPNIEQKQARLKSRFFLDSISVKNSGLLIGGIGVINIEKPFILQEPSRIVFDLPNTIVLQELRDKEIAISETATAKIGQFEPSKARIVIRTDKPDSFKPVYSTNLQTLLITNSNAITGVSVTPVKTELSSFKERKVNSKNDEINIIFSNPVIYSIKKENNRMNVSIYNLINFDYETFNSLAVKNKTGIKVIKTGINTFIFSFPVGINDLVDCYETLNASQLRFVITRSMISQEEPQNIKRQNSENTKIPRPKKQLDISISPLIEHQNKKKQKQSSKNQNKNEQAIIDKLNAKSIILDPGHGGNDTGAMRNGILEKDLTLQIALKVRECLREKGLTNIIMTRSIDKTLSLDDRVQIANTNDSSIFISIHINASVKSEIHGIETHYYTENGYNLAKFMHKDLMDKVNAADRGLFKSKFYVITHTEAPAVLLELGFISNEHERNELVSEERQLQSAQAIADGIIRFLTEHLNEQ